MPHRLLLKKFGRLTPIQEKAIPLIMEGKNLLVCAPTGHGKTETAFVPLVKVLSERKTPPPPLCALYITPLRALNRDLEMRLRWWGEEYGITIEVRHGDTPPSLRQKQLKHPPHVLITTPETLQSILCAPKFRTYLHNTKYVIIDEVHELFGEKRGAQLVLGLLRLSFLTRFQRVGLSATVFDPHAIASFFGFSDVVVEGTKKLSVSVRYLTPTHEDAAIAARMHVEPHVAAHLRFIGDALAREKTIVFVNTRQTAEFLGSRLKHFHDTVVHHGSLARETRLAAETHFKTDPRRAIVATSSLELGIDIGDVHHVIQYGSPRQVERLLQRIGRAGHRGDEEARGTIVTSDIDDYLEAAVVARRAMAQLLDEKVPHEKPLDVLAHQIAGMVLEKSVSTFDQLYQAVRTVFPYRTLTEKECAAVVQQLVEENLLRNREGTLLPTRRTRLYYYEHVSVIPDEVRYTAIDVRTNQQVSVLDEPFVAQLLDQELFILGGRGWRVVDIQDRTVLLEPYEGDVLTAPHWEGTEIPVPFAVAQEVGQLRHRLVHASPDELLHIARTYHLQHEELQSVAQFLKGEPVLADDKTLVIEERGEGLFILHACAGTLVNETIAHGLSHLLTAVYREPVSTRSNAYRIVLDTSLRSADVLSTFLKKLPHLEIEKSSLFFYEFAHVAKLFGLLKRDASFLPTPRFVQQYRNTPLFEETRRTVLHQFFDLPHTEQFLSHVRCVSYRGATKFGEQELALNVLLPHVPVDSESLVFRSFVNRVTEKEVSLICTYCRNTWYSLVRDLPERIVCGRCGSSMVGLHTSWSSPSDLMESASLISASGKRAVLALSTYGVGLESAKRILRHSYRTDTEFFLALLKAQQQFLRTKFYWSTDGKKSS